MDSSEFVQDHLSIKFKVRWKFKPPQPTNKNSISQIECGALSELFPRRAVLHLYLNKEMKYSRLDKIIKVG